MAEKVMKDQFKSKGAKLYSKTTFKNITKKYLNAGKHRLYNIKTNSASVKIIQKMTFLEFYK